LQFRWLSTCRGGLPPCPESPVWLIRNGVTTARALPKADMRVRIHRDLRQHPNLELDLDCSENADVCALGRLVTRVCAMTFAVGTFWFQTGAGTRKGRSAARDPRCSTAVSIRDADVVIEADAARVTEPGALGAYCEGVGGQRLAGRTRRQRAGHHCPVQRTVKGPPPWNVYRIETRSAIVALATEPGGLARFRF